MGESTGKVYNGIWIKPAYKSLRNVAAMTRVFIISNYPMFGRGLERLLSQDPRLQVMGRETDLDRAIERIRILQPDVVIFGYSDTGQSTTPAAVLRILAENSCTRVVGVSLQDNHLCVYQATQGVIHNLEDLVEVISFDAASPELG